MSSSCQINSCAVFHVCMKTQNCASEHNIHTSNIVSCNGYMDGFFILFYLIWPSYEVFFCHAKHSPYLLNAHVIHIKSLQTLGNRKECLRSQEGNQILWQAKLLQVRSHRESMSGNLCQLIWIQVKCGKKSWVQGALRNRRNAVVCQVKFFKMRRFWGQQASWL